MVIADFEAGIGTITRLDEQKLDLFFGEGLMLDPLRNDKHLPGRDMDGAVAKVDP